MAPLPALAVAEGVLEVPEGPFEAVDEAEERLDVGPAVPEDV